MASGLDTHGIHQHTPICCQFHLYHSTGQLSTTYIMQDGNGRVARLLGSIPLLMIGLPPLLFRDSRRTEYFNACTSASVFYTTSGMCWC